MHNRTPEVLYQNLRGTIRLYHGSKSGIQGPIRPASRANTDFGKGFYMSPKPDSPKALIATHKNPTLYELSVNLSGIKCVRVSGVTWALLVAYNRGKLERFKGTKFYEQIADITLNQDMVVGPIADDRMYDALTEFFNNRITDYTMLECMQKLRLGDQRVRPEPHSNRVSHHVHSGRTPSNSTARRKGQRHREQRRGGVHPRVLQEKIPARLPARRNHGGRESR